MKRLTTLVVLLLSSVLYGCTLYVPPDAADRTSATVTIVQPKSRLTRVAISRIDEKLTSPRAALAPTAISNQYRISAGKHTFQIRFMQGMSEGTIALWLVAEPGREYRLHTQDAGYRFTAWFEDAATQLPVGGVVGSSDEPSLP